MVKKKGKIQNKVVPKKRVTKQGIDKGIAIVCLILNIVILPGLGSLIGRKTKEGIWQLVIFIGGIVIGGLFIITIIGAIIGIPIIIMSSLIAWIWGILTGVKLIKESK